MIYLIATNDRRFCKIGRSRDPQRRMQALQSATPFKLELIATRNEPDDFELQCHEQFAADHVRGEWFELSAALLEKFEAMAYTGTAERLSDEEISHAPIFSAAQVVELFGDIENPITRAIAMVRAALDEGITPAALARRAGLHRNALYGAADPGWDPKVSTLEKIWPHIAD